MPFCISDAPGQVSNVKTFEAARALSCCVLPILRVVGLETRAKDNARGSMLASGNVYRQRVKVALILAWLTHNATQVVLAGWVQEIVTLL